MDDGLSRARREPGSGRRASARLERHGRRAGARREQETAAALSTSTTSLPHDMGGAPAALFETFDLTLQLGPGSAPWLSAASCAGFIHGIPRHDAALPDLQDLLDLVYDYTDGVQFAEPDPAPELSRILGKLVFGDPMLLQLFLATRGVAADRGRQTLVRILASPHLAVLPWELLPDPTAQYGGRSHRYLALAPDVHLVRMARGRTYPARATWLEPPLNLLIVLSSPTPQDESEDWLAFDIFEVKHNLLTELSPLVQAGLLNIDVEDRPTVENLRRRIGAQRRGYHLFHYVGHALPDRVILEDRAGRREDLSSSRLVELLRLCPDLRLALFAGCETARAARDPGTLDTRDAVGWRDLLSLADYCVQEACPTVMGMQAVLPFATERVLARFFYQGIATGYSIAEALRLARGAIQSDERLGGDLLDWSVPTLFVGSGEPGPLLPRSTPARAAATRRRVDLKLGLQQRTDRFFARDLPLRQSVDVLGGLTRERVLMVTGANGVGKTSLVDRALEELGETLTHVLYLHFDRLAPEVLQASIAQEGGAAPDLNAVGQLDADAVLERLCRFADELLRNGGQQPRTRDRSWSAMEWWERLVEGLVQHKLVLAIDEIGLIDRLEGALLNTLVGAWLAGRMRADGRETSREQMLDYAQQLLVALPERDEASSQAAPATPKTPSAELQQLQESLRGLPKRTLDGATQALHLILEDFVAAKPAVGLAACVRPPPAGLEAARLTGMLQTLDGVRIRIGEALKVLADRRSSVRIVITAADVPKGFPDLPSPEIFEMRLAPLTWPEMWRWIRRNLPGLVSYGDEYLSRLWPRLGIRLEPWEELERRVLRSRGKTLNLEELAMQVATPLPGRVATAAAQPHLRPEGRAAAAHRGGRPSPCGSGRVGRGDDAASHRAGREWAGGLGRCRRIRQIGHIDR